MELVVYGHREENILETAVLAEIEKGQKKPGTEPEKEDVDQVRIVPARFQLCSAGRLPRLLRFDPGRKCAFESVDVGFVERRAAALARFRSLRYSRSEGGAIRSTQVHSPT
ncbi:MAG: hypothetical protein ACLPVW_13600 [Terriglobales bacterium]